MNFKHLHYFWRVAKTGGAACASEQLHGIDAGAAASRLLGVARARRAVGAEEELGVTAGGGDERAAVRRALQER